MTHLGSRVSALLDGHLGAAESDRCWEHVHSCHACRDLVEREGWVKTRLAQLSLGSATAPDRLKSSLLGHGDVLAPKAFPVAQRDRTRHRGLVAIGGGAAGACVVGVLALGLSGSPRVEPRPPTTDLSRPIAPVSTTPSPLVGQISTVREKMRR